MRETKAQIMAGVQIQPGSKSKLVDRNTVEYLDTNGNRVWRFHRTDIASLSPSGILTLNSGGYRTPTTKGRINWVLGQVKAGMCLHQSRREWFIGKHLDWTKRNEHESYDHYLRRCLCRFGDGIQINCRRGTIRKGTDGDAPDKKLVAEITRYSTAFAAALPVPPPSNGDCFHCLMRVSEGPDKGKSLGDASKNKDHLLSHVKENYFVPSLLARLLEERGAGGAWFGRAFGEGWPIPNYARKQFARWINKYLYARLIQGR